VVPRKNVLSVNQSKFIFRVMTENYKVIHTIALERLQEKHYVRYNTGRLNKQNNTNRPMNTSEEMKERRGN